MPILPMQSLKPLYASNQKANRHLNLDWEIFEYKGIEFADVVSKYLGTWSSSNPVFWRFDLHEVQCDRITNLIYKGLLRRIWGFGWTWVFH